MTSFLCHKCGASWESDKRQPGFKEICSECSAYLHCCRNCRFHTPSAHNQCYIPNTEYVADREKLNFCEEFEFREGAPQSDVNASRKQQARDALDAVFGDDDEKPPPSFDNLFKE